jgi:hypothetical protein
MQGKGPGRIYEKISDLSVRQDIERRKFDAQAWLTWFNLYKQDSNKECMRDMRFVPAYPPYFQKTHTIPNYLLFH